MKTLTFRLLAVLTLAFVTLTACGAPAPAATLADVPTFTGATEIADTLVENMKQAGTMGTSLEQKVFAAPADTGWDAVKSFYDGKLGEGGWKPASMPVAMPANDMFQLAIYQRGSQNLTVMLLTDPSSSDKFLIYSLS
jgi:hypothetical protein